MKPKRIETVVALILVLVLAAGFTATVYAQTQESGGTAEQSGEAVATQPAHAGGEATSEAGELVKEAEGAVAEHVAEATGEEHHIPWWNFIFRVINFIIFIFIIYKAAGKKIAAFFGGRRRQIREELDDLAKRQDEAKKKLEGVEKSIANLAQEKAAILDQAKQQGEALKQSIVEKAQRDAEALKAQAKRTAENEAKAALEGMRAQMAELVVEAARKMVEERLTDKEHEKLVDEYLTKVVLN